jgi:spermidine synthase
MSLMFEEIDYRETPIGELALRRRKMRPDGDDIWEIKLNGGYLMSSEFVAGEIALADLALAMIEGDDLDIVVGGLGLGFTAVAVLRDARVTRLTVVDLIPEVIEWHDRRLLPLGEAVAGDARCRLLQGDFFALARAPAGFGEADPPGHGPPGHGPPGHDAVIVDIDHSTTHFIDDASAGFYSADAIAAVAANLRPGGVFALWSTDPEDAAFTAAMRATMTDVRVERIEFPTPYRDEPAFNLIYLGRRP